MQNDNDQHYQAVLSATFVLPGEYAFRLPQWRTDAMIASTEREKTESRPIRLQLRFSTSLEEEFAAWDQLSDEALNSFEASLT